MLGLLSLGNSLNDGYVVGGAGGGGGGLIRLNSTNVMEVKVLMMSLLLDIA